MKRCVRSRFARMVMICALTIAVGLGICFEAHSAEAPPETGPARYVPQADVRLGGVLADSYGYHRHGAAAAHAAPPNIAPEGGWYGYGFPVETYRWGWFGAQRYYPRVVWHRGYYGDCCRWGYRRGY